MPVKVGGSYVSEAAYNYAKTQAADRKADSGVVQDLAEKFPNMKFSIGTAPFAGTGTNNVSISPQILKQMEHDPDKRIEYEALIYDIAHTDLAQGRKLKSAGFIIGNDGGLRAWSVSQSDNGISWRQSPLKRGDNQNWWEKMLAPRRKKNVSKLSNKQKAVTVELSTKAQANLAAKGQTASRTFVDTNDLGKYLQANYAIYKQGMANISSRYLAKCLTNKDEQQKLFDNLQAADAALQEKQGEIGFQGMRIRIDENGEMTMESSKSTVAINEEKSRRQIAAAATKGDMKRVLALLRQDLQQVEDGLKRNMCDAEEVKKAKALIEQAEQQMGKLPDRAPTPAEQNRMSINMLI